MAWQGHVSVWYYLLYFSKSVYLSGPEYIALNVAMFCESAFVNRYPGIKEKRYKWV